MITSREAAERLGIAYQTLYQKWIKTGKLKSAKLTTIGHVKLWLINEREIEKIRKKEAKNK